MRKKFRFYAPMRTLSALIMLCVAPLGISGGAHAEKLLFTDANAVQDWWYSDETDDGSLMLSTRSNDPEKVPLYLFCKGHSYSMLFQPPVPPERDEAGGQIYRYVINGDGPPSVSVAAKVQDGHAEPIKMNGSGLDWLLLGRGSIYIDYISVNGKRTGNWYVQPPFNAYSLFTNRCANQGFSHEPPPPLPARH
jgi:hypothetical protein